MKHFTQQERQFPFTKNNDTKMLCVFCILFVHKREERIYNIRNN